MASKSTTYRPRRTRIYGANYDIGESYYKKQLESLDNKYSTNTRYGSEGPLGRFSSLRDERRTPEVTFRHDVADDEEFFKPVPRKSILSKLRDDFDEDLPERTFKPFALSSKLEALDSDHKTFGESARSDLHTRVRSLLAKERSPFLNDLESQGAEEFSVGRRLKVRSQNVLMESSKSATDSLAAEEASSRARATRARLANLESEMLNISEKQTERENRSKSLRKLLNESDSVF